jgi:hypothetical protein
MRDDDSIRDTIALIAPSRTPDEEEVMADASPADEIVLSAERRALLTPKLAALLEELGHLTALETPDLEPVTAQPAAKGGNDERQ